ncbi:hypothetical protein AVEN_117322-1 [Araneus ventricosus]|uniref:Integrase catalytic domain-containing protein n=1 Tax=Araneus ventricosus TaxID=182803 RepID=A0A4Y2T7H0_ARAVE|nr:hypothetical protein AVEN_117322-1 [Araneus ventricosus]
MWKTEILWDDKLYEGTRRKFSEWFNHSHLLKDIKIPRWFRVSSEERDKTFLSTRFEMQPPYLSTEYNEITGEDLAGPLFLCGGGKVWIVLFTCAVYPAIHLELVASLSAETFMQALRRIWARRGRRSTLYTDNSTNFIGAANTLKTLDWDFIQRECAVMKIKCLFSPPSASWYGGFWERMIRCVKELLRKCLGRACTYIHNPRRPTHPKSLE